MVGGDEVAIKTIEPILKTIAPGTGEIERTPGRSGELAPEEQGYLHCGPSGAGHFVKMVHNGIEYGMMAAFAEGLNILDNADVGIEAAEHSAEVAPMEEPEFYQFDIDTAKVTELWRRGSVVSSWLLDLTAAALQENPKHGRPGRPGLGLRRGSLDGQGGGGHRRTRSGAGRVAVRAVRLPRRGQVRQPGALGDAAAVRRPQGAAGRLWSWRPAPRRRTRCRPRPAPTEPRTM